MRFLKNIQVTHFIENIIYKHTMAPNLSYAWNFGSLAGLCLILQIITGIFLAMHYTPETSLAFASIEHIMRDVQYGWLIRSLHANGASMFFLVVYAHMWRSMYYGSYGQPRVAVWMIGMIIYILMMATAFLGYILPWGQMSLWGATVITNLFSAVPFIGQDLVIWLWGGYSVANPTLNRFFSLHYILPILIAIAAFLHLILLHQEQSNNPIGITLSYNYPSILFHPYYVYKDLVGICVFVILYIFFVFFYPNVLGHSDNYIMANALVTPTHIVPEWYFLPFYAVLRSIPNKSMGIIGMAASIAVFFTLPYTHISQVRALHLTTHFRYLFWCFTFVWLGLIWIGSQPAVEPYITIGRVLTILYFLYFIFIGIFSYFSQK
jgi:ubiquinol-cytochrome c reductase cytochrome b subunit